MIDKNLFNDLKNKSILITGATGFFGKNLIDDLIKINNEHGLNLKIYALSRRIIENENIISIAHDVSKKFEFEKHVDFLIHAATPVVYDNSTPEELLNTIINGTKNAIDFAIKNNVQKFLLISSGAVYGVVPEDTELIDETQFHQSIVYDPKNPYATGKRISEYLVHTYLKDSNIDYSIARGFAFSGRYLALDQHLAIGNFVRDAVDTKEIIIKGNGLALRSYMDNEDLVNWLMTILLKSKKGEAYNLGSDKAISIRDLATLVSKCVPGVTVNVLGANEPQLKANRYVPSIRKANKDLGLELIIDLNESVNKMIDLYRKKK